MTRRLLALVAVVGLTACSQSSAPAGERKSAPDTGGLVAITTASPEALARFTQGERLAMNVRADEAAAAFSEALKLDPDFVLARAYLGQVTPGADGLREVEKAAAADGKLPQAERLYVEGIAAARRGQDAAATAAFTGVTQLAPRDWRGFYGRGIVALNGQKFAEAAEALKQSITLDPLAASGAQNMLGYAALRQCDTTQAIAAFEAYARALPQEPNPQDSLGEALLAAGRFKDAEAAFHKALALSPQFWAAHEGIAFERFYTGDWAAGREALTKARDTATRPGDKVQMTWELAAVSVAQGNIAEALASMDASLKVPGAQPSDVAFAPVHRAHTLFNGGRFKESRASADEAVKLASGNTLPPGLSRNLLREALRVRVLAESRSGDVKSATTTVAALDADAATHADDPPAQSAMHFGRAMLAVAKHDSQGAKTEFAQCSPGDDLCLWQSVLVGDRTSAAATRATLLKIYKRNAGHLVIRTLLGRT